jgi:membrane protein YqaA with SNARE-associated domain
VAAITGLAGSSTAGDGQTGAWAARRGPGGCRIGDSPVDLGAVHCQTDLMMKRLYNWCLSLADKPSAPYALGAISFAESSFFPLPPDLILIPMSLARPERAWFYALLCTLTSVAGGVLGYLIGWLLYDTVGMWLISMYGYGAKVEEFRKLYQDYGQWIILIKGLTPIPFKLVTIASGMSGYNFTSFVLLSLLTRGARFFVLAGILHRFGGPIRAIMDKHTGLVFAVIIGVVVLGFVVAMYLI